MRRPAESLRILAMFVGLWPAAAQGVSSPRLIADLATVPSPLAGSAPADFVRIGSLVLFTAQPDDHARRLFRTDGTTVGTVEIGSACGPLAAGGFSLRFASPARAYYAASCGGGSEALWSSDGTAAGTLEILSPGTYRSPGPFRDVPQWVEEGESILFLQGGNYASRLELWRTNGKPEGTSRLGELSLGESVTAALFRRGPSDFLVLVEERFESLTLWTSDGTAPGTVKLETTEFDGRFSHLDSASPTARGLAFLVALQDPSRHELWHTDGTAQGTVRLAEFPYGLIDQLGSHDGAVYFSSSRNGATEIWRSDGSVGSTRRIVDLDGSQGGPSLQTWSSWFQFVDDDLYFVACSQGGRACGLLRVPVVGGEVEPIAGLCSADPCQDLWVRSVGGRLLFTRQGEDAVTVWSSALDGSGAEEVAPLCATSSCLGPNLAPTVLDGVVFFAPLTDEPGARELWASDGTAAGTLRLAGPLAALPGYSYGQSRVPLVALPGGEGWLFAAGDAHHGLELWRARPQADAGALVADLRLDRPGLFNPEPVGTVDSTFVFALMSDDGSTRTLYRHTLGEDGVEPFLTVPVRRGRYGSRNAPPALRPAGNAWFFIESDFGDENPFARQIWRYDPVSRDLRTLFAEDPQETGIGARADDLVPSGADFLFLGSTDAELHPAIYRLRPRSGAISKLFDLPAESARSVGVSRSRWFLVEDSERVLAIDLAGRTRTVLDEFPGAYIDQTVALTDGLLFAVDLRSSATGGGVELRQSDGAAPGTRRIAVWEGLCPLSPALPPAGSAAPALFASQSYCSPQNAELWVSDGSFDRTRKLKSLPGAVLDFARKADRKLGVRFFLLSTHESSTGTTGYTLWKSDGTSEGTQAIAELPGGIYWGGSRFSEAVGGAERIYFAWEDSQHGQELWSSDGTAAGTGIAADLEPGPESSWPAQLRTVGDQVIFIAGKEATGVELWQVDGGVFPPQPVADLYPGIESSAPSVLAATEGGLFFLADDGVVGRELWEVDRPSVAPCVADATTLCLANGRFRARAVRRDFAGELGAAGVVPLTGESGYFWFFAPGNPEVLLKIVDACGLPGFENFWAYSTGLTNVEVELEVVDTLSGERKAVRTALGEAYGPLFDSGSFQVCAEGGASAGSVPAAAPVEGVGSSTVLPLLDGRFEARASWRKRDGTAGVAAAVPLAGDSGFFWFFDPSIVEVLVKMVDACGFDGFDNFWVFAGGLTDVEVHLEVTDTRSGEVVRHDNPQGRPFSTLLETGKLRVCAAVESASSLSLDRP